MATGYRLLSFTASSGEPIAGVLIGDRVYEAAKVLGGAVRDPYSVLGLLQAWDVVHPKLHAAAANADPKGGVPLAQVKLLAPILYPGELFCAGANYWDHLDEMAAIAERATGKRRVSM